MNLRASSHALLLLIALGSGAGMLRAGTNQWTSLGPYDGSVTALAIDPQNPATVYAETYSGIIRTTDGAASWRMVNNGLPVSNYFTITGIVVNPQNASTLYAWPTGNAGFRNGLLLKSTDGASSWSTVWSPPMAPPGFNPADGFISSVAIDPQTPENIYLSGAAFANNQNRPSFVKTSDGGATWRALILPDHFFPGVLLIDSRNPATIYLSATMWNGDPAATYYTVLKSADGGVNWTEGSRLPSNVSYLVSAWTKFVRQTALKTQLVLEISERADGRRFDRWLVFEKQ